MKLKALCLLLLVGIPLLLIAAAPSFPDGFSITTSPGLTDTTTELRAYGISQDIPDSSLALVSAGVDGQQSNMIFSSYRDADGYHYSYIAAYSVNGFTIAGGPLFLMEDDGAKIDVKATL